MRRIKTLALTLACVTGPYVPVHAKLTLLRHAIRWKADTAEAPDVRFDAVQSIVTSTGLNDGGLFETNLQDARYLPMEGCGVVARFRLEVLGEPQFDKTTLADAILTLSYTAREGGDVFRAAVEAAMPVPLPADTAPPLLMSFRHDFADEWRVFLADGTAAALNLTPDPFPMAPPATIPFDRQPYRARATAGTYAYADRAWALTDAGDGRFELVDVALEDIPLQSGSLPPATSTLYFGAAGLQWTDGTAEPPRKVADLLLMYEKH
jgi:Tc toxin complex TcA C-terminal TcB-binding domain